MRKLEADDPEVLALTRRARKLYKLTLQSLKCRDDHRNRIPGLSGGQKRGDTAKRPKQANRNPALGSIDTHPSGA